MKREIWFARIVMILGARELVDVAINTFAYIKIRSGLPIVSASSDDALTLAYLASSVIIGFYLIVGGSLFSRLAYGKRVSKIEIHTEIGLPDWPGCMEVAIRIFGVNEMIRAVLSIGLAIDYYQKPLADTKRFITHSSLIEVVYAFEHILIGFVFIALGGIIARYITGTKKEPNQTPEPTTMAVTPPAAQESRQP